MKQTQLRELPEQSKNQAKQGTNLQTFLTEVLPHHTMLIQKDKTIVFANKIAREAGAIVGDYCWHHFGQSEYYSNKNRGNAHLYKGPAKIPSYCSFCLADKVLEESTPIVASDIHAFGRCWEIHWIPVNKDVFLHYALDITHRKKDKQQVMDANAVLEKKIQRHAADLESMDTALNILLQKREKDKLEIEEKIFSNYKLLIAPIVQNLKNELIEKKHQTLLALLEANLNSILSPFSQKLSDPMINLTPTEIQIADLVKFGKSNKEISCILNSSVHTISRHRENIREKLNLKHKKINLRSFLRTL